MPLLSVLHIKLSAGDERHSLSEVNDATTVGELKSQLEAPCGVPASQQRLIYKGRVLVDAKTLAEYGTRLRRTCSRRRETQNV